MKTFGLQDDYAQLDFNEISVADLEIISGGSGSGGGLTVFEAGLGLMGIGLCAATTGVGAAAIVVGGAMVGGSVLYSWLG